VRGMDRLLLGDDQPGATAGALLVVGKQARAGEVVLGQVGEVGGEHDAVGYGRRADPEGGEEVGELGMAHGSATLPDSRGRGKRRPYRVMRGRRSEKELPWPGRLASSWTWPE